MSMQLSYFVFAEAVVGNFAVTPDYSFFLSPSKLSGNYHKIVELVLAILFFSSWGLDLLLFGFLNKKDNKMSTFHNF